ncbi:hypothetical protein WR43_00515 [Mycolicibacter arupensis]|uniref:LppX_LprAFG lipoprotein n=1 Tax=Mycolicibacter arupensis TaxID=342002 RepID=A0A0F5N360_9MYCO|nr:hypothetical protein WR43_00515 [Mycolicibacter arupensis]ORA00968.1 hypothetical protein BST15_02170 [Mycolicibacter arupensis]
MSGSPSAAAGQHSSSSAVPAAPATSSKRSTEPLPDAAAILKEASVTTADAHSVHLALSVTGTVENMAVTALDADVTRRPAPAARGYAKIAYRGAPAYVRFAVSGGDFFVSQDNGRWIDYGPAGNLYDAAGILSPGTGLADILTDFVDPEVDGRDVVDGVHTVRISGEISAAAATRIVPQLRVAKRTPCTVWIQEAADHQLVALRLAAGDDAVQMNFSNWNAPVAIATPVR